MKTSYMAALLMSSALVAAQRAEMKFAKCEVAELDGEDIGLNGTLLFFQREGMRMKTFGLL